MHKLQVGDSVKYILKGKKCNGTIKGIRRKDAFVEKSGDSGGKLVPLQNIIKEKN